MTETSDLNDIYQLVKKTPLEFAPLLSKKYKSEIYIKREDLQPINSFKIRGAYYSLSKLTDFEKAQGVITASAGNHAQGVALAAQKLKIRATIVMPRTTPPIKIEAVKSYQAKIELHGDSYSEAYDYANELQKKTGQTLIHPFDDPDVISGQGSLGYELIEQLEGITHVFVPVGGGGLISGVAQAMKQRHPEIKIIAVEPVDSNIMELSLKNNKRLKLDHVGIFADGVAVKQLGQNTFEIAKQYVDECLSVSNDQICAAIKEIFEETRTIVEPAGALSLAGLASYPEQNMKAVIINSGANIQFERLQYIAERTLIGSGKEALFSVEIPEVPGALNQFCESIIRGFNITQLAYRFNNKKRAHILIGVGLSSSEQIDKFSKKLEESNYHFSNLTNDDLTKEHIRYMIGGSVKTAENEYFYQIKFPERPGALHQFLQKVSKQFNISAFHYRGQGADSGLVLIGFQATSQKDLEASLDKAGLAWTGCNNNEAIKIFLQ